MLHWMAGIALWIGFLLLFVPGLIVTGMVLQAAYRIARNWITGPEAPAPSTDA